MGMPMRDPSFLLSKPAPRTIEGKAKARAEDRAWRDTCADVDRRDRRICQITGRPLQVGAVDAWSDLARHHLELRSKSKARRYVAENVLTVSRAIHQLVHAGALRLLDKRGRDARAVAAIDHVAWNRNIVQKGDEPCRITRWPVLKD